MLAKLPEATHKVEARSCACRFCTAHGRRFLHKGVRARIIADVTALTFAWPSVLTERCLEHYSVHEQ